MRWIGSILLLSHLFTSVGQNRCGVDHRYFEHRQQQDARFEQWLKAHRPTGNQIQSFQSQNEFVYRIPVVVHIIHQGEEVGTGSNLSDSRIVEQIEILNRDFRRQNADTALTPVEFRNVAADTQIEFVLAKRDPEGLPTSGIVRKRGSLNGYRYSDLPNQSDEFILKSESQWPVEEYLNIYVTDLLNGFIGYAQFPFIDLEGVEDPNYDPFLDGVVIDYNYFGVNPTTGGSFESFGRTLTHEVGHFLGLRHVWGDRSQCEQDDFCEDTPQQTSSYNTLCPNTPTSSCGTSDMYSNYLNYTNDACMNIFTRCQKLRMRTVIENSPRVNQLTRSPALEPAIQVARDLGIRTIISPTNALCESEIFPVIEIRNYGTSTINDAVIRLFKNDEVIESLPINSQLAPLQTQILNFTPITGENSTRDIYSFRVHSVNNQSDQNPENDTFSIHPVEFQPGVLPYTNSFDDPLFITNAKTNSIQNAWQVTSVPFQTASNQAASLDFDPINRVGSEDIFLTPIFDLSSLNSAELSFSYSYSVNQLIPTNDRFTLYASLDCGQTFLRQQPIFQRSGNALITSDRLPQGPDDWENVSINISQFTGEENVRFAFAGIHGSGGALFVDSLQVVSSSLKAYDVGISEISNLPIVSCFSSVIPALTIRNYGFETIESIQIDYQYRNISETIIENNLSLNPGSASEVLFPISRLSNGEYNISFSVSQPNDTIDEEPSNNAASFTFYINDSRTIVPARNNFESPSEWIVNTPTDTTLWEILSLADGNTVLRANAFDNQKLGVSHWFVSPLIDLSDLDSASMTFRYAYQGRLNRSDRLAIYASQNCGGNFTDLVYSKSSTELAGDFSNEKFIPQTDDQWVSEFVDLSPYAGSSQLRLGFVFENGNGNDLYIDDIEFYQSSNASLLRFQEEITVFPNPATTHINLHLNLSTNQKATIRLIDISGRIVRTKIVENALNQAIIIETIGLRGSYLLSWETKEKTGYRMIVIN